MESPTMIMPYLWLGPCRDASRFDVVLNATRNRPFPNSLRDDRVAMRYRMSLSDNQEAAVPVLHRSCSFIASCVRDKLRVLVCCSADEQRSLGITVFFMSMRMRCLPECALQLICTKRPSLMDSRDLRAPLIHAYQALHALGQA